jgi:protoporphyrinogen oxidase
MDGNSKPERWGIVGGGLLGMTLAHRLAQVGKAVTLFESAGCLGGLASAWTLGDVVWDRHYHVILRSDLRLRALLAELGLEEEIEWIETGTGFYTDGRLHSMSNTLEFLRFPPIGLVDKLRLGALILYASRIKNWRRLEQIAVADWLKSWTGRRTLERIWLPLLRAKLGENYRIASAAFIWAVIARMYAARRSGLKKEMFGYVPGGYARILKTYGELLEREKVDIQLNSEVAGVVASCPDEVQVQVKGHRTQAFDYTVVTAPAPIVARLCSGLTDEEKERLKRIRYQGIICASLLLERPLSNYYVTNITETGIPFTAVIEMTALVARRYFGGKTLVYLPKYVLPGDPAFASSDEELQAQFVGALERMYPHFSRDQLLAFRLSRVPHVLAIPTLNYSRHLPTRITSVPGLYIVNSAQIVNGTLNVNETVQLAESAFRDLLEETEGRSPRGIPARICVQLPEALKRTPTAVRDRGEFNEGRFGGTPNLS